MSEPLFYKVREAAQILGVSKTLLHDRINAGEFPCVRIGRRVLISRLVLEKMAQPSDNAEKR